jgi:hypothetical protein
MIQERPRRDTFGEGANVMGSPAHGPGGHG